MPSLLQDRGRGWPACLNPPKLVLQLRVEAKRWVCSSTASNDAYERIQASDDNALQLASYSYPTVIDKAAAKFFYFFLWSVGTFSSASGATWLTNHQEPAAPFSEHDWILPMHVEGWCDANAGWLRIMSDGFSCQTGG
jgi:hypothetical protein